MCDCVISYHVIYHYHIIIISHHIVDLKRQNRLKVGTDKHKLKVKMQSVSDDDVWKRLLEKVRWVTTTWSECCEASGK